MSEGVKEREREKVKEILPEKKMKMYRGRKIEAVGRADIFYATRKEIKVAIQFDCKDKQTHRKIN